MKITPRPARHYLLVAVFLIALPSILSLYRGHTGKFLVATGQVRGDVFEQSVIYLSDHGFWGAFGFVINKPLPEAGVPWKVIALRGGPVEENKKYLLLEDETAENNLRIVDLDVLRRERPDIIGGLEKRENDKPIPLFSGYAGWAVLQLNYEIVRGHWGVIDYDPSLMSDTPREKIWERAMEKLLQERPAASGGA